MKRPDTPSLPFLACREYLDENGIWNPRGEEPPLDEAFQVNLFGSRADYLQFAEFIGAFADRDASSDGDFHEHVDGLASVNSKGRVHLILRKETPAMTGEDARTPQSFRSHCARQRG